MATKKCRRTGGRDEWDLQWSILASLSLFVGFGTDGKGAIGNGGTAGRLRTTATTLFRITGVVYSKASTDDLWDLHGQTATSASQYRAIYLYLSTAGAATIGAGDNAASAALALAALPALDGTKCIAGVYVAGPSTDFTAALAAQGTIYDGIPAGIRLIGNGALRYSVPSVLEITS